MLIKIQKNFSFVGPKGEPSHLKINQFFVAFSDCNIGFHLVPGDYPGIGQLGHFSNISDTNRCGSKCLGTAGCMSYEYSTTDRECNLNSVAAPSEGIHKDYAFCVAGNKSVLQM